MLKIKTFLKIIFKYNFYYKSKFITLILLFAFTYSLFFLGFSVEEDVSYFFERQFFLSFSTPFVLTPSSVRINEFDEYKVDLRKQIFQDKDKKILNDLKNILSKEGFSYFNVLISNGTLIHDEYIPVLIMVMDLNKLKYFEGISYDIDKLKDFRYIDCLVSEGLKEFKDKYILLLSPTITQNYNLIKLNVKDYYKYKSGTIKNLTFPNIILNERIGKKYLGVNDNDDGFLFIYKDNSYNNNYDKQFLNSIIKKISLDTNLYTASETSLDIKSTFNFINLVLLIFISLVLVILTLIFISINIFSLKQRFILIGIYKTFGLNDKKIFFLLLFEFFVINLLGYILGFLSYIFYIKVIFKEYITISNIVSNPLRININLFLYFFIVLFMQVLISCRMIYNKLNREMSTRILTGEW